MASQLKQFLLSLLSSLLISCISEPTSKSHTQQLIQAQITAHYDSLKLEGYQSLSFSSIDTIAVQREQNGDILVIIGEVTHRYKIKQGDRFKEQSQVFSVQVYEDEVIEFPAKEDPNKNERPFINI